MESNIQKMFRSVMEKRSRVKGNLRLKVLLKSQYDFLYHKYLAEHSTGHLYYTGIISLNGVPDSHSINRDESSRKIIIISKKRSAHSSNVVRPNKRLKTSDNASQSVNAECLTNNINHQNSSVQSQRKLTSTSQVSNKCGKENEDSCKKFDTHVGITNLQSIWEKNMLQNLYNWLKECGINLNDEECYFSPYLSHPINAGQYQGIRDLLRMWQVYWGRRSKGMTQFQKRKNTKILIILKKLVQQYKSYQETSGDNEILNLQLRKNRCKLKKVAKKIFAFLD